jgi:hypothetical protein
LEPAVLRPKRAIVIGDRDPETITAAVAQLHRELFERAVLASHTFSRAIKTNPLRDPVRQKAATAVSSRD